MGNNSTTATTTMQPWETTAQVKQPTAKTTTQPWLGNDDATVGNNNASLTTNHNHKKAMTAMTTRQPWKRPLMACNYAIAQVDCCPPSPLLKHISLKPLQLHCCYHCNNNDDDDKFQLNQHQHHHQQQLKQLRSHFEYLSWTMAH